MPQAIIAGQSPPGRSPALLRRAYSVTPMPLPQPPASSRPRLGPDTKNNSAGGGGRHEGPRFGSGCCHGPAVWVGPGYFAEFRNGSALVLDLWRRHGRLTDLLRQGQGPGVKLNIICISFVFTNETEKPPIRCGI